MFSPFSFRMESQYGVVRLAFFFFFFFFSDKEAEFLQDW